MNEVDSIAVETKMKNKEAAEEPSVPFFKLFMFADSFDYCLMAMGTIGAAAHGIALPVFFLLFGELLNSFGDLGNSPHKMYREVSKYALYFVYLAIVILFASWAEVACWMQTGERQTGKLRIKYLEAMLKQDVGYFDVEARTGDIIDTISSRSLIVQEAISEKMGSFIHFSFTFVGGFVVGFAKVWQLGLLTLAVVPAIALVGGFYAFVLTGLASKGQSAYSDAGNIAQEVVSQIRTVYSFVGEEKAVASYSNALKSTLKFGYKAGLAKGVGVGCFYGVMFASWALLLWYGGVLVRKGSAAGGSVLSTIFAVLIGSVSLGQASPSVSAFAKARVAAYKIREMIDQVPTISSSSDGKELESVEGHLELHDIHFSYPSRPDVHIFQGFSLVIPAGRSVAIVGGSGSGKSTVVSLIERFYDPISGEVRLDGHNIKSLQLKWLRAQIGLVNQEPALFATTIQENILYGKADATKEEIEAAAKAANAHNFISELPDGYDTQVGERGVQLSGGQKQRIAIARAMIKNPSVLLFDEATSALDAESERVVQDALNKLMVGHTTIIVAHRLSTIRNADSIAVVQDGKIIERGTHDELMSNAEGQGAYAALVRLQQMAKEQETVQVSRSFNSRGGSMRAGTSGDAGSGRLSFARVKSILSRQSSTASEVVIEEVLEDEEKVASKSYFWRLLKLNMPEWLFLLLGSVGAIFGGFVNPTFAFILTDVLKIYFNPDENYVKSEIQKYSLIIAGLAGVVTIIYIVEHYSFGVTGESLTKRVREMMFSAITKFEVSWFDRDENGSSQVTARLASNASQVRAAMGDRIAIILQNLSLLISSLVVAFVVQWRVAIVIASTMPLLVLGGMVQQMFLKGFAGNLAKAHDRATKIAGEAVGNIRTVAAFNAEAKLVELMTLELEGPRKSSSVRGNAAGLGYGLGSFCLFCSYGLGLWYGAVVVRDGKGKFGDVMKAFFVLVMTSMGIADTIALTPDIVKGGQALKALFVILDRKTAIDPDDAASEKIENVKGEIELKHVEFYYPARPDITIFKKLDLKVCTAQSLAVVGASGSGKSSIIALVQRFYDPVSGTVLVDGMDIRLLNLRSYRRHVGMVQQEPALFATSIEDNIRYGKNGATESEIVEAAKAANAHNFVSALPDGYSTNVGERGTQLSGGQKQRIAIARAVLKNPSILLLDEATSALDAESESIVQDALDRLMKGRTTIVVAHRLSTIRHADQIAVIQDGKIIEQGNHWDLIAKPEGAYSRLIKLQQQSSAN